MNKKLLLAVGIASIFVVVLVTAALVDYYSNTVKADVTVSSPIKIVVDESIDGVLSLEMHGGESVDIESTITNLADVEITGILTEVKVLEFDGVGITFFHSDCQDGETPGIDCWEGNIPVCTDGIDAYYYIGPIPEGFPLTIEETQTSTSTIIVVQDLEPRTYNSEIRAINVDARKCTA